MCEEVFKNSNNLKYHIITKHTRKEYICNQCPSTYTHPMHLKQHMKVHTDEKIYLCEVRATKLLLIIFVIIVYVIVFIFTFL